MKPFLFFAAMAAATSAGAQNLVQNPNFDTDASNWQLSIFRVGAIASITAIRRFRARCRSRRAIWITRSSVLP
jgi:hypothetical protein